MSVIVKDMEMPRICGECEGHFLSGDGHVCCGLTNRIPKIVAKFNNSRIDLDARKESINSVVRPDWCPLRPLPEKHGRLIEADSLKETLDYYIREAGLDKKTNRVLGWVKDKFIDSEQTIVEAEGD